MITCTFEHGHTASLRHVTCGVIIVNEKKEVLLIKRAPHLLNGNLYAVPGGFLDRDETAAEGALRELKEETGFTGKIISLFEIIDSPHRPKEDRQNVDFRFAAKIIGGKATLSKETTEVGWYSQEKLPAEEQFAFDYRQTLLRYFEYLNTPFSLPLLTSK